MLVDCGVSKTIFMKEKGIHTLYLVTDHTSFYERYGWEFLSMVQVEGESEMARMYIHKA